MDDSTIICDEEEIKLFEQILMKASLSKWLSVRLRTKWFWVGAQLQSLQKKITCKAQNFYILLVFLLITIALLKTVSKYCYLIKYQAKEKHLLSFRGTKLKPFCFGSIN